MQILNIYIKHLESRSEIEKYRKGLLIGSGCYQSEVFTSASTKSDEELANIIKFYDYVEVQPVDEYCSFSTICI